MSWLREFGLFSPTRVTARRTHGFLVRMSTKNGRLVLKRRRAKGRKRSDRVQRVVRRSLPMSDFRPHERIRRRPEFQQVYERGVKIHSRYCTAVLPVQRRAGGTAGDRGDSEARGSGPAKPGETTDSRGFSSQQDRPGVRRRRHPEARLARRQPERP